jgi:hypothetical protein
LGRVKREEADEEEEAGGKEVGVKAAVLDLTAERRQRGQPLQTPAG